MVVAETKPCANVLSLCFSRLKNSRRFLTQDLFSFSDPVSVQHLLSFSVGTTSLLKDLVDLARVQKNLKVRATSNGCDKNSINL
jgi:hypothetical protein